MLTRSCVTSVGQPHPRSSALIKSTNGSSARHPSSESGMAPILCYFSVKGCPHKQHGNSPFAVCRPPCCRGFTREWQGLLAVRRMGPGPISACGTCMLTRPISDRVIATLQSCWKSPLIVAEPGKAVANGASVLTADTHKPQCLVTIYGTQPFPRNNFTQRRNAPICLNSHFRGTFQEL